MKAIAEELVSAFNTTTTDYDAIDVSVKILEKRFSGITLWKMRLLLERTPPLLRVNPKEETLVSVFTQNERMKKHKLSIELRYVWGQVYILPFVKVTHYKGLNGDYELLIGWLKWQLAITI
tara:strand:+ start:51 stop:413 length:363 start_codon:yes stop_codon:yes gene_type:complete